MMKTNSGRMNTESYQPMNMGPRNLLILFFSAVAVSLVILIILSSLVFKNLSLDFNTHLPESTPDIGRQFGGQGPSMNPDSKADNVSRSTLNVPPESVEPAVDSGKANGKGKHSEEDVMDTAPVSDDSVLENDTPLPLGDTVSDDPPVMGNPKLDKNAATTKPAAPAPRTPRPAEPRRMDQAPANPAPAEAPSYSGASEETSGPPVPGQ